MELPESIAHFQILLFGTIAMAMLVVFIILFVVKYQSKRIQEQEARRQMIESHQEKVLEAILQTQEKEQKRISRDLHDELGSALAMAKLNVGHLTNSIENPEKHEIARDTYTIIDDALKNVRRLSRDLSPVMLEKFGLADAIEALVNKCSAEKLIISYTKPENLAPLAGEQELNIFRIVQELLSNAIKHSQATQVSLELRQTGHQLQLTYADNGTGFTYNKYNFSEAGGQGIGMVTINTRVRILKGNWQLNTASGAGTSASFQFPVTGFTQLQQA